MNNTVTGKVLKIGEVETFKNDFTVKKVVITTDEKYPQDIELRFVKDDIVKLDNLEVGQDVTIHYNLRGQEYNGKYYVNLNGWRVESENAVDNTINEAREKATPVETQGTDDLPF
jgi:hypothetical protein